MRQQLWRHLLTFKPFLVQASSIAADQTLITQPTAVARALCRSSFQDLQAAEALPPWMLSGFAYSRYFAVARSPVGALNETRLAKFLERYHNFDDPVIPKFHYGSHYSSAGTSLILGGKMRHLSTSGVSEASKQHASEDPQTSNKVSEEASSGDGEEVVEDPKETRPGWLLKVIVALTVSYMAFHGFPMIGESSIRHSLALLRAEDPLFKRSGASRLALFAKNDDKRRNVVKAGGIERLMSMLEGASDDQTRCEAIKALVSLAHCEEAVLALHEVRADAVFQALLRSSSDPDILKYSSVVLEKLDKGNCSSLGEDRAQKTESSLCIS